MKPFVSLTKVRQRSIRGTLDTESVDSIHQTAKLLADVGTDSFVDNRDYKTVPNWQPCKDKGIWEVATLGPKIGIDWIKIVTNVYEVFLTRGALAPSKFAPMDSTSVRICQSLSSLHADIWTAYECRSPLRDLCARVCYILGSSH